MVGRAVKTQTATITGSPDFTSNRASDQITTKLNGEEATTTEFGWG